MATAVIMPRQGQSVESCILSKWFKKKGDAVKKGEILFSYETDKASFEEEAAVEGTLLEVLFKEDDDIPCLQTVAIIGKAGEDYSALLPSGSSAPTPASDNSAAPAAAPSASSSPAPSQTNPAATTASTPFANQNIASKGGETFASPRAKMTAEKLNVVVGALNGTGPNGRVIEKDVREAHASGNFLTDAALSKGGAESLAAPANGSGPAGVVRKLDLATLTALSAPAGDGEVVKLSNIRKVIAKNMIQSLSSLAQLTLHISADARRMQQIRNKVKAKMAEGYEHNLTLNDMVCYALVKTLKKHKDLNAHFLGDSMKYFSSVHLGIAVDTPRGLMVPTIREADLLNIEGLSKKIKESAALCKSGKIDPALLSGATFTVSNLGAFGIEMFTPVINPPQTGILGVNTITLRPAEVSDGVIGMVPYIGFSLTFDHQALDGAPAAAFLSDLKKEIENLETGVAGL